MSGWFILFEYKGVILVQTEQSFKTHYEPNGATYLIGDSNAAKLIAAGKKLEVLTFEED